MVKFEFQEKVYSLGGWNDVKLSTFIKYVQEVMPKQPEPIKKVLSATTQTEMNIYRSEWEIRDTTKALEYMIDVVSLFFGIDADTIAIIMERDTLEMAYWGIQTVLATMEENPDYTGFEVDGIEYLLPANYMQDSTFIEFAESAQYQQNVSKLDGGEWLALPEVIAVLCRPKNEVFDSAKVEARKQLFLNKLTMNDALQVAFFLQRLNSRLADNLLIYSQLQLLAKIQD